MSIKVALNHRTQYRYDRPIHVGPQVIRLRPAPHCRTPIESYSLRVTPEDHFVNWQQDPHGNFLARVVFEQKITELTIDVDLVANLSVINPFDFFVESEAETYPFRYRPEEQEELKPYLVTEPAGELFSAFLNTVRTDQSRTIDFLVDLNQQLERQIDYVVRMEPGVQTCEQTLGKGSGSCRDSAWLLVQVLRHMGLAARFTSGYLIQLTPDVKSLDGPSGTDVDFTDLHAWTEVFLPGAGWVGLDPTSGLLTGEGHLPLASTPNFSSAAAITGAIDECETEFSFEMSVTRVHEDPRVTKPYTEAQWEAIDRLGQRVDTELKTGDVRLTMGGEPTFVSIDNPDDPQWQTEALGEEKNRLANDLLERMKSRFSVAPLLHFGQGKWYPGEPVPRWAKTCYWRTDGLPLWQHPKWLADESAEYGHTDDDAAAFASKVAERLRVGSQHVTEVFEDALYHLWEEQRLPADVDLASVSWKDSRDRQRLAKVLEHGLNEPVGFILPLIFDRYASEPKWVSGPWRTRASRINLLPGDSPIGYRLPLNSLTQVNEKQMQWYAAASPFGSRPELPSPAEFRFQAGQHEPTGVAGQPDEGVSAAERSSMAASPHFRKHFSHLANASVGQRSAAAGDLESLSGVWHQQDVFEEVLRIEHPEPEVESEAGKSGTSKQDEGNPRITQEEPSAFPVETHAIPFALCVEVRHGTLHVFMPPTDQLEQYLEILAAVEATAVELERPVVIEGYRPPNDHRLTSFSITPDPGVIEVNVQPASDWEQLKQVTEGIYQDAYRSRLRAEKFELDGSHAGTGGGNHIVLGGSTPMDSPLLRRPDLLRSLIGFWQNHPSLSYLFSSRFIGPTSQAPRADEGRADALYELQLAFDELERQLEKPEGCPPWLADRIFRNLLIDVTGNTHRAEFCIDKLYSPDSPSGRLGLLEFRGFEMPPHPQMSLTQQLLIRVLIAKFWKEPYRQRLVDWKTRLHDQFTLPSFVWQDFCEVLRLCQASGYELQPEWFAPHFDFRFPVIGTLKYGALALQLRQAIEPWNVLGEETTAGGTSRYVDSSLEKIEVRVTGHVDQRYIVTCNQQTLPLRSTGTQGEYVAGVRFRAWQPPSCLHPTIPVDGPLTFDVYDRWLGRAVAGCQYHVGHPGGLNPATLPVNSLEAESRRASRFSILSNRGMTANPESAKVDRDFPLTLDLRKTKL